MYLLFIVYGSFFPFQITLNPSVVREDLARAVFAFHDDRGVRTFSTSDFASNILLGLPFGVLLVAGDLSGRTLLVRLVAVALADTLLATTIEIGQLFAPARVASVFDVLGQVGGSLVGAGATHMALRWLEGRGALKLGGILRRRPALGPLVALLAILAADALYPYAVTLDPSTVWSNVKRSSWALSLVGADAPWHALLVDRILPYAAVTILVFMAASPRSRLQKGAVAILAAIGLAVALEIGKLFIEGRSLRIGYASLAAAGALLGVLILPAVAVSRRSRGGSWIVAAIVAAFVAYQELRPFEFSWAALAAAGHPGGIEWIPFASYLEAEPSGVVFDVGKKIFLGGVLGAGLSVAGVATPVLWTTVAGAALEVTQIFEVSRQASVTDALLIGVGGYLGVKVLDRYRTVLDSDRSGMT